MPQIQNPADEERYDEDKDDMAVVRSLAVAWHSLSQDVYQ